MGSNYRNRLTYEVDVVFCIDATGSMEPILDQVKYNALNFYKDVRAAMDEKGKLINRLRARVVAFRDYFYDKNEAMMVTDFFDLPSMEANFELCLKSIIPNGGGDDPEDGLEALAYAMKSKWCTESVKKRHIIVIWSDDGTHAIGFGKNVPNYPKGMPKSFDELTSWWGNEESHGIMDQNAKRLIIFAPDKPYWSTISDNWDQTNHYITDDSDVGLSKVDYQQIIDAIVNSI